ncbi:MAG: helix-turn-helix transcriptional regulator, partial [Bacillota bacterium]|nr:helix-turn-helix transcriptional regulator [Bacillota bacterium]
MILADKILALRKNNGWSQEELAEKLNVSRQSVSKWESAAAIPDINKILELAKLFGVTTDYLLKDDMEKTAYSDTDETAKSIRVTLKEAADFLESKAACAKRTALGAAMCVISPVPLILLAGMADAGGSSLGEDAAGGAGVVVLLLMIAAAVAIFITSGAKMKRFDYLKKGDFELEYGVSGIVKEKKAAFDKTHTFFVTAGAVLCILCSVPLIAAGVSKASNMTLIFLTALLLAIVSFAVYLFITAGSIKEGFDQLLLEGEFDPEVK